MKTNSHFSQLARRAKANLLLLSTITALATTVASVQGASLAELLEQGIYSEQTRGDLDSALKAYEQVIKEAKSGEALAAQAQYRLGVVQYKKKNYTEATAAFESLVKNHPDQKELVKLANEYLANAAVLLPAPWVDGEELQMSVKLASGVKIGTARYTVDQTELNGRKVWHLTSYLYAGVKQLSQIEVEAESFKPIRSRWKHTLLGDSDTTYFPGKAEVKIKGQDSAKTIDIDGVTYDNEEFLALMRRLPLTTNYSTTVRVFAGLTGGNIIPIKVDVTALETVKTPAGTFECYKVDLNIKQTFWYSADEHRYLVKFEAGGVVTELTAIRQRPAGQPEVYKDALLSITAPNGWLFFTQKTMEENKQLQVLLLDPDANAETALSVVSLENFKPEEKSSLRALADKAIAEATRNYKEFTVRPDSWKETTFGGVPALSVAADFKDGDKPQLARAIFATAGGKAIKLHMHVPSENADAIQPQFESIVKSLKLN